MPFVKMLCGAAAIMISLTAFANAQMDHSGHGGGEASHDGHSMSAAPDPAQHPSVAENIAAMERMHAAMSGMDYSGDPDIDFARGMIPHHQAAIDMANILLEHGESGEMRELAEEIIEAQEREIAELEAFLEANDE